MRRKNPGPSSLPNAPIELTSLLDVIFIFLFVVMIGYALNVQKAEAAAETEVTAAQEETAAVREELAAANEKLREAEDELEAAGQELSEREALSAAYEERIRDYEGQVIGERVKIITISGSYDKENSTRREVVIMLPGSAPVSFTITPESMDSNFSRMRRMLVEYINTFDEADRTVVVISVNSTKIQHRDKDRLDIMIDEFAEEYSFVY